MEASSPPEPASASEPQMTTVELLKNGDARLVVSNKRFIVSTEILKITSDYFKALFSPSFREGQAALNGACSDIVLHDDDPDAMEIILSILHYNFLDKLRSLTPNMLLNVARHCDKYQCTKALEPWVLHWTQKIPEKATFEEYDLLLTAVLIFGVHEHFTPICIAAIRYLHPEFLIAMSRDRLQMPRKLQKAIKYQISNVKDAIILELQSVPQALRYTSSIFDMKTGPKRCALCREELSIGAIICRPCGNKDLHASYCTNRTRAADYLEILSKRGLWPMTAPFDTFSIAELVEKIGDFDARFDHDCDGGHACPLRRALRRLNKAVQEVVQTNIVGFCAHSSEEDLQFLTPDALSELNAATADGDEWGYLSQW